MLLTLRSESRGSQNGAMAPFSVRATTRKALKSTREPPFHATGRPVARPDRDNRGRQSVDGDAVDNNGNAVTSEDVLSGPLRPADPNPGDDEFDDPGASDPCAPQIRANDGGSAPAGSLPPAARVQRVAVVRVGLLGRPRAGACPNLLQRRPGPESAVGRSAEYQRFSSGAPARSGPLQQIWTTGAAAGSGRGGHGPDGDHGGRPDDRAVRGDASRAREGAPRPRPRGAGRPWTRPDARDRHLTREHVT